MTRKSFLIVFLSILTMLGTQAFGYDVQLKKVQGKVYKPVPLSRVQVMPVESYKPAPGDEEVGTLTLTFDRNEIGNERRRLYKAVAQEAASFGASVACQLAVTFDKNGDNIIAATYRCIRRKH